MKSKHLSGFSLIELLISLIIISLITSTLMPVLTKKLKNKNITLSSKAATTDCKKLDNENRCMICTSNECTLCTTQINTPDGLYVNPKESCDYKNCIDKFLNCAKCNKDFCTGCKAGYILKNNECKITDAPCLTLGKICVAKFNAGDSGGLSIPSGINIKPASASTYQGGYNTQPTCWMGQTAKANYCDSINGGYSGCNRTVCNWYAAKLICETHGWRLPTPEEAKVFGNYSKGLGNSGLQFCDTSKNYNSAACSDSPLCPGEHLGWCQISRIWGITYENDDKKGYYHTYHRGVWSTAWHYKSYGFSVRCVRDL